MDKSKQFTYLWPSQLHWHDSCLLYSVTCISRKKNCHTLSPNSIEQPSNVTMRVIAEILFYMSFFVPWFLFWCWMIQFFEAIVACNPLTPGVYRNNHRGRSVRKGVLRNFTKITGKHLCQRLWLSCFPVNFAKFLRMPVLHNTYGRLLLSMSTKRSYILKQTFWSQNCCYNNYYAYKTIDMK